MHKMGPLKNLFFGPEVPRLESRSERIAQKTKNLKFPKSPRIHRPPKNIPKPNFLTKFKNLRKNQNFDEKQKSLTQKPRP